MHTLTLILSKQMFKPTSIWTRPYCFILGMAKRWVSRKLYLGYQLPWVSNFTSHHRFFIMDLGTWLTVVIKFKSCSNDLKCNLATARNLMKNSKTTLIINKGFLHNCCIWVCHALYPGTSLSLWNFSESKGSWEKCVLRWPLQSLWSLPIDLHSHTKTSEVPR